MKKSLLSLVLFGFVVSASAFAAGEEQESQATDAEVDAAIAMCEEKYSAESYADEEERNTLINQCVDDSLQPAKSGSDDMG
jgi:hypothetical protein